MAGGDKAGDKVKGRVLVVDDEESLRYTFREFLCEEGYEVRVAEGYEEALGVLGEWVPDLVFLDILLGSRKGTEVLGMIREMGLRSLVIMVTGAPSLETAAEALRLGAFDYISKPVDDGELLRLARRALETKRLEEEREEYRANLEAVFSSIREGIVTIDADFLVKSVNGRARVQCGFEEAHIGRDLRSLSLGCDLSCARYLSRALSERQAIHHHRLPCHPRGGAEARYYSIEASPLLDRLGRFLGGVLVARDESRLERLEKKLEERQRFQNLVGQSQRMRALFSQVEDLAGLDTTVLITGESGTGKELVAEALHFAGERRGKELVKVNCAALSEGLLENELFGHVRGAFTGAHSDVEGRFQKAHGGTLFLDEIGDISAAMQAKLLRVLQDKSFERLGDTRTIKVDVRVLAATNQDLEKKVKQSLFRKDLYYRLKVVELKLPPLRERREDIPLLVDHFLRQSNEKFGKSIRSVSEEAHGVLLEYCWPGNVRQLQHALEHASIKCKGQCLEASHLPEEVLAAPEQRSPEEEVCRITAMIEQCGGNKAMAARRLGISRKTLYEKLGKARPEGLRGK